LRRHGVGNLRDLKAKAPTPKHSAFKAYEPGYIHIDVKYLPQMADESSRRYLFVAIDRATRWVFVRVFKAKTAANARRFLRDLERACPLRIRTILTDNGKEFTDRLFGLRKRAATGAHEFDTLCVALDIEHRLTPPKSPQTNGMVERFNGRIEEVLQSHHFRSGEELETTLHRYVWLYNQQLPQSALGSKTPLQAMKDWHKLKPELFKKQPYYLPGCDKYPQADQWVLTLGWSIRRTGTSGDQGVDLIAEKDGLCTAIQCKDYDGCVGNRAVQEVVAGMRHYGIDRGAVLSQGAYTQSAKDLAASNEILLLSPQELIVLLDLLRVKNIS
jgi:transposase InsO family protein